MTIPVFNFSESYSVDALNVTQPFKYNIFQLTGKVNGAPYKGFGKGEVLFLGATGSRRGYEKWRITYKFAASPNVVNMAIGGATDFVVTKEGWEYLWVRFDEHVNQHRLIKIPTAYYVERVYPYGNLASLGIGV